MGSVFKLVLSGTDASTLELAQSQGVKLRGLATSDAGFVAEDNDPWISFETSQPVNYVLLEIVRAAIAPAIASSAASQDPIAIASSASEDAPAIASVAPEDASALAHDLPHGLTKIYCCDLGEGFSEDRTIEFDAFEAPSFMRKIFVLDGPADEIRLDPTDRKGKTGIQEIRIEAFAQLDDALASYYSASLEEARTKPGCLIVTHNLTQTGAPLLVLNIAKAMRKDFAVAPVCLSQLDGAIAHLFSENDLPLYDISPFYETPTLGYPETTCVALGFLKERGFDTAYLNSIISAAQGSLFKAMGMKTVSLIHETGTTISIFGWDDIVDEAVAGSDVLVFPAKSVEEGFDSHACEKPGEEFVRPQGVCPPAQQETNLTDVEDIIPAGRKIMLCGGTANLRKGVDIFCQMAYMLADARPGEASCVWVGGFEDDGFMLGEWLKTQYASLIERGDLIFIPFLESAKYRALLNKAVAFWSTSRDDTYPSVVMEAMAAKVPVVAFKDAGGAADMLADGRGYLIEDYSLPGFVDATLEIMDGAGEVKKMRKKAEAWVKENLSFDEYIAFLESLAA